MSIHPGQILLDRYRVENYIGSGGMGSVFRVWDLQRNVSLAIKVLRGDLAEEPGGLRQLQAEATTLEELAHPNIVAFYGLYQSGEGAFLLEDYVEGESLKDALKKRVGKPVSFEETLLYFKPLCAALQYAHNLAIIHCDVKPGNILRDQRNQIYLADFGIARYLGTGIMDTSPGGTPAYMAPEQIQGGALTKQTDIYALGVVLYEMLTGGRLPYTGGRAKIKGSLSDRIQWEHVNKTPVSPRRYNRVIPPSLEAIILRCLEKEPEKRYPNALDLLNDLSAELQHQPVPEHAQRLEFSKLVAWSVGLLLLATAILVLSTLVIPKIGTSSKPTLFAVDSYPTPTLNTPDAFQSTRALSITQAGRAAAPPPARTPTRASVSQLPEPIPSVLPSTAPTPSPTPRLDYPVNACMTAQLGGGNQVRECVTNVHRMPDGSLRFDFTWTASLDPAVKEVLIYSALGNTNMYLVDDLGNRYDFLQAGGDATLDIKLSDQQSAHGWFLFPAPVPRATSFVFVDDDNAIRTQPITLR